jgi:predicted small lipoprotein YifL
MLLLVLAMLVAAGCGQYGQRYTEDQERVTASDVEKPITDERFTDEVRERDGCTEVEEFDSEGGSHRTDPGERVEYEHNPPHSGDHYQIAAPWGLYDSQTRRDEELVHNLEHGHLWITHKGLSDEQQDELLEMARINPYHLVLMPRKENPKDGVFITAWTAQVYCERPSAAALQYMVDTWRDQGPELFTDDEGTMGLVSKDD